MHASVCELKSHLSAYLHQVREGKELTVTLHHVPVARVVPFSTEPPLSKDLRAFFFAELDDIATRFPSQGKPLSKRLIQQRKQARY